MASGQILITGEVSYTQPSVQRTFKTRACIDWIRVRIFTREPTQFQWIQARLTHILALPKDAAATYVEPITPGAGGVSDQFEITLHDEHANTWVELARIMGELETGFSFSASPTIGAIEIALDFYPKIQNSTTLGDIVHRLQSRLAARGNARQYNPATKAVIWFDPPHHDRLDDSHPAPDRTLYIGNKDDAIRRQVYFKRTDHNRRPIDPAQYRARAEFTLSGEALKEYGLDTLADIHGYKFERLAGLLHFRQLKPLTQITADKSRHFAHAIEHFWRRVNGSVAGYPFGWNKYERYPDGTPRRGGRAKALKHNAHTTADDELNRIVRKRLSDLSRSFST